MGLFMLPLCSWCFVFEGINNPLLRGIFLNGSRHFYFSLVPKEKKKKKRVTIKFHYQVVLLPYYTLGAG